MQETGCPPATGKAKLRFESVKFSDIPGQSKLFLQYQSDPDSLRKYYPSAVTSHVEVAGRVREVLDAYVADRDELCSIIGDQNRRYDAGEKTFSNIELLRRPDTVAVLTGQQTGLFTGPLYTIYKALSAIKMAACLRDRGIGAVPVFWAATEDHDFPEIASTFVQGGAGQELRFDLAQPAGSEGQPVGSMALPESIGDEIRSGFAAMHSNEFTDGILADLLRIWAPGRTIGDAFCSHLQRLFRDYGLIVVDPLDPRLKRLAAPMYSLAVERMPDLVPALVSRSNELAADGFHAQVLVTGDHVPLFYHTDDGVRRPIRRRDDLYRISGTDLQLTADDLRRIATSEPDRLSPGVMLRPVAQDFLFPTVCYFGGAAEIAYFAQNSEAYRILGRPVTTILHRQSFTVIESKHARTLEKYDLDFQDVFKGFDALLPDIVERFVNPTTTRLFADVEEDMNTELNRLDQELVRIDPTLAENLATRRRKILYHIGALQKKFNRVQIERDEIVNRQLRSMFESLLPHAELQERRLNVCGFLARYGDYFVDWVHESVELEERGHRLLYL